MYINAVENFFYQVKLFNKKHIYSAVNLYILINFCLKAMFKKSKYQTKTI